MIILKALALWQVLAASGGVSAEPNLIPCNGGSMSVFNCNLPCEGNRKPELWISLRRPTPYQQQDWFNCQCQRDLTDNLSPYRPWYVQRNTDRIQSTSNGQGGYHPGAYSAFKSQNENALVQVC